ncbi:hypothetical protein NTHiID19_18520 [Haemophilus influenzae]|nr:hypothetical protein CHBNII3_07730 [Haemophilus influenzae]GBK78130.1 hypothetical protein NTHIID8_03030 [Haemophilus influenzae]GBK84959.1 hypothetical protein NTHiID16_01390 [Haemophilus influenzae]GBK91895.1 hypothetical protein NTHiID19_18520 [Haemophilus influenzae]
MAYADHDLWVTFNFIPDYWLPLSFVSYHDNVRKKLDALGFIFTGDIRCGKSILALYVGSAKW